MNSEKLKVIAEGMGYTWFDVSSDGLITDIKGWSACSKPVSSLGYKPDTIRTDQMIDIMERLFDIGCAIAKEDDSNNVVIYLNGEFMGEGETTREAVCNAAFKHFNQQSTP